jgi:hypothetical protein
LAPALPASTLEGERDASAGTGLITCRERALEVAPPGAGLKTVMASVPAAAIALAGRTAVREESELKTVGTGDPFTCTAAVAVKLVPVTDRVKLVLPAIAVVGEIAVSVGRAAGRTCKGSAFEVPPPGMGLITEIRIEPVWTTSAAGMVAVTDVGLLNVVAKGGAPPT